MADHGTIDIDQRACLVFGLRRQPLRPTSLISNLHNAVSSTIALTYRCALVGRNSAAYQTDHSSKGYCIVLRHAHQV